jgi:hypothetical protein
MSKASAWRSGADQYCLYGMFRSAKGSRRSSFGSRRFFFRSQSDHVRDYGFRRTGQPD